MATVTIPFKRGDTFLVEGSVSDNAVPVDLTGWTIRSQVRNGEALVADLGVTITNAAAGQYQLTKNDTTSWPVKDLSCDIEYTTDSGQIVSTETFTISCKADVTR